MADDIRPESTSPADSNFVRLCVRAGGSFLDLEVTIENSSLELPRDHTKVWCDRVSTRTPKECRGFEAALRLPAITGAHYYVNQVDRRIEFGTYWPANEDHDNPLTQALLGCFVVADRARINAALSELADHRSTWWSQALLGRATKLGKNVNELTDTDMRPLLTGSGYRNYPEHIGGPEHSRCLEFQVNRHYFEAQLRRLLARLLDEAVPTA
jgi:hypothetical protein